MHGLPPKRGLNLASATEYSEVIQKLLPVLHREAKKGRREYQLQLKLARFLFDQGFTPIFSSRLGTSEPDLTDLRHQQPLVLEAKILHERAKGDILKGFNQIYRYIATIGEDEGYYVIFNPQKFVLDVLDNVVFNAKSIRIIQVHVNPAPPSRTKLRALTVGEDELISVVK